jgi:hypothetical protein
VDGPADEHRIARGTELSARRLAELSQDHRDQILEGELPPVDEGLLEEAARERRLEGLEEPPAGSLVEIRFDRARSRERDRTPERTTLRRREVERRAEGGRPPVRGGEAGQLAAPRRVDETHRAVRRPEVEPEHGNPFREAR